MFSLLRTPMFLLRLALIVTVLVPLTKAAQAQVPAPAPLSVNANGVASTSIVLRWIKPSKFFDNFPELPRGLVRASPDDTTRRLFVQGTPKFINEMQEIVRLVDVEPRRVRLAVRVLRAPALYDFASVPAGVRVDLGEPGTKLAKSEAVTTAAAMLANNEAHTLQAVGDGQRFHLQLTPHINGDDSVTISAEFSNVPNVPYIYLPPAKPGEETPKESQREKYSLTKRVANGVSLLLGILPSPNDKKMAYYLEVTPVVAPRPEP